MIIKVNRKIENKQAIHEVPEGVHYRLIRTENQGATAVIEITGSDLVVLSISRGRLRIQLKREGLIDQVEQLLENNEELKIAYESEAYINRFSKAVKNIQDQLELTDEQVDEIFSKASKIEL